MIPHRRFEGPPEQRFWPKVDRSGGDQACWEWLAGKTTRGYGTFGITTRRTVLAYRFAYELLVGPVTEGMELDHLCRNRGCVNPSHLEPVTHLENVRRGTSGEYFRARTHCKRGHPFAGDNLLMRSDGTGRACRTCRNANQEARRRAAVARGDGRRHSERVR